jgi:hypothetical protein
MNRRSYTVAEVTRLTGLGADALFEQLDDFEFAAANRETRLPWREVIFIAFRVWPLAVIFSVLRRRPSSRPPKLLSPKTVEVTLPDYQIRMLKALARREHISLSTFLQFHLLDLESAADHDLLEGEIPGFSAAMRWPDE